MAISRADNKAVKTHEACRQSKLSWRFSEVDKGGPFAWPVGNPEASADILAKLGDFDSMYWREIEGSEHHAIERGKLSKDAQNRLLARKLDDIDEVFSFRLSGKARVFGIRNSGIVKLLWWDPEHRVCPSIKKHT